MMNSSGEQDPVFVFNVEKRSLVVSASRALDVERRGNEASELRENVLETERWLHLKGKLVDCRPHELRDIVNDYDLWDANVSVDLFGKKEIWNSIDDRRGFIGDILVTEFDVDLEEGDQSERPKWSIIVSFSCHEDQFQALCTVPDRYCFMVRAKIEESLAFKNWTEEGATKLIVGYNIAASNQGNET